MRSSWTAFANRVLPIAAAALLAACGGRDAAAPEAPAASAPAAPGPRYVCEYDPDPANLPECELESKYLADPIESSMMMMLEVTRFPAIDPTPEQKKAAEDLVRRCHASAEQHGWHDFAKATADGYKLKVSDDTHYNNVEFLFDDRVLDPDRPEYLMFYDTPKGKVLTGFMFVPRSNTEEGPQIGGNLTRWHYHTWHKPICMVKGIYDTGPVVDGTCATGSPSARSPEMLHVWLLDHPQGPFATAMGLPPALLERLLAEREARSAASATK
ncbi:MAG TPA: hypothetical protein VFD06_04200 [Candidatus Polarisedimenticolia bacterium]|nr:hypothetical protein [Candidatus Polarisedimenticolia bacterium]